MQLTGQNISLFLEVIGAGGAGVFLAAWVLRKLFKDHLDQDIHAIVVVLSGVAAGMQYFDQIHAQLPPYILGVSVTAIYGVSQFIYKASKFLGVFLNKTQTVADTTPTNQLPGDATASAIAALEPEIPEATF